MCGKTSKFLQVEECKIKSLFVVDFPSIHMCFGYNNLKQKQRRVHKMENKEIRLIIAGGRDFDDYKKLKTETFRVMREVAQKFTGKPTLNKQLLTIISGMANGADKLGAQLAKEFELNLKEFVANWDRYGRRAGYMRNVDMAKFASESNAHGVLIAFWDGQSKGTKHMIDTAKKTGLDVHVVQYKKE
jgi:hypothetical protein